MKAVSELKPDIEVHAIVAACENMISGKAYKPGDILKAKNGKTIESRYNPDLEAQRTIQDIKDNELFFIVTGCAGGILIESILKKNKNAVIIAVEKSKEDFDFLKQIKTIKLLSENPNVIFCDKDNLLESIVKKYIPVFYGNLRIIEQHAWCMENREASDQISGGSQ